MVEPTNKGENKKANKKKTAEPASIPAVRVVDKVTDWLERQTDDTNEDDETIALAKKKPGKPTNVRTLGLVSEPASVSGRTVMPRAGPVSARTMEIMSRVKSKVAAPKATMTEEEIEAVLSDKDIFLTPRRKKSEDGSLGVNRELKLALSKCYTFLFYLLYLFWLFIYYTHFQIIFLVFLCQYIGI